ncbi:unnamed protein product [Miscanthus lutarioriparius]|uniref:AP2/ERF domain-containing protein n=1 Tax=Miscanthus lutarioriparius TaxID=422564 RepID=A0A811PY79_9POAL|nr:unnamed protein product [Miscanthus lutarioriparius]
MSSSPETEAGSSSSSKKFKGVRKRKWGKWVSEIRLPNSRERIWLGSYDAPDKAARAFDAAFVCLRGRGAAGADLNFPDSPPPCRAGGCSSDPRRCRRPRSPTPTAPPSRPSRRPRRSSWMTPTPLTAAARRRRGTTTTRGARRGRRRPWWRSYQRGGGGGARARRREHRLAARHGAPAAPLLPYRLGQQCVRLLQVPPPAEAVADEDMDDGIHGATASLWSFDSRDSYFRY